MTKRSEELLAAVIADRSNTDRFSVCADSLEAEGDPRGQLISLMLAREKAPTRKLFAAQQEHLARSWDALELNWAAIDDPPLAWWRGFIREAQFDSPADFQGLDHPLFSLLDAAVLVLPGDSFTRWLEAMGTQPGWRSVRLEIEPGEDAVPLAPLFEALPNLKELTISFDELGGALDFEGARSASLERLVMDQLEGVEPPDAASFPALKELWLTRHELSDAAPLREGDCWQQLERVVLDDDQLEPTDDPRRVLGYVEPEDHDVTSAFVVVAEAVEPALVRTLIASMTGLDRLVGEFGHLKLRGRPFTVIRLYGSGATELFPYAVARSLERHFGKRRVPIASFALSPDDDRAQGYAQSPEVFADKRRFSESALLVRELLDGVLGFDPGLGVLQELRDALACAAPVTLAGSDDDSLGQPPLLAEIDPAVKPPPISWDDYDDPVDAFDDLSESERDPLPAGALPDVVPEEPPLALTGETEESDEEDSPEVSSEDPGGLPENPDLVWAEGPVDPDPDWAELKDDPRDLDVDAPVNIEQLPAENTCARCDQAAPLRRCAECAELCCASCARERRGVVSCLRCVP